MSHSTCPLHIGVCAALIGLCPCVAAASAASADGDEHVWRDPCRPGDRARAAAIQSFYDRADTARIWVTEAGPSRAGRQLVRLLEEHGGWAMTACIERALNDDGGDYTTGELEVMLTDAYLALRERRAGPTADAEDRLTALTAAKGEGQRRAAASMRTLAALRVAIMRYRRIAAGDGWPRLGGGPAIAPGDRDARVPALRERLRASGDLGGDAVARAGEVYEGALVLAVEAFQRRHGLDPDGVVDAATRAALDTPARERARQLAINRDRMVGRTIDGSEPVVRVNIPAFRAALWEEGEIAFTTRAIVGRPEHPTPQLDTWIEAMTLNPAWYVPRSIVREQLAPRFAEDAAYAERNGFQVIDTNRSITEIDWDAQPAVDVRQAPGPGNALGRLKFEMPNPQRIYLHDTPKKHLFESRQRTFSAGCVRIEEPMALAARLTGIDAERIERLAAGDETRTMRFGWRVPVQLVYFTAWVDAGGHVQFRRDIYHKDDT